MRAKTSKRPSSWSLKLSGFIGAVFAVSCLKASKIQNQASDTSKDSQSSARPSVIYGADNRHEPFEEADSTLQTLAESTVALIKTSNLSRTGDGRVNIKTGKFGENYQLCDSEPFREQQTAPYCSGFLVGSDLVMTAGHCVMSLLNCSEASFVFGYALAHPGDSVTSIPESDVYTCKSLIHSQAISSGADFAIVQLDRPVLARFPLRLRQTGSPAVGTDLVVMGHPSGLPLKISGGARIRALKSGYFTANLDTYGGNSGSAVFNARTYEIEGILVRGETDYVRHPKENCMINNRCAEDACRGEDVTSIGETLSYLGQFLSERK